MFEEKDFDMHAWVEERLSPYLDRQLAPDELERLEAHLRECEPCSASLESLRQTVSLLRQAPVPAPSRQFTLPVTRSEPRSIRPSFGFLRIATMMATLFLCAVVSFDLFGPVRFAAQNAVPAPAQFAAPVVAPTSVALAQTAAPAATDAPASLVTPTTVVAAPKPTSAAPQSAAQPLALSTATRAVSAGASEAEATVSTADQSQKTSVTAAPPPAPRAAITITLASPSPLPTSASSLTPNATTATTQLQARAEATRARDAANAEPAREIGPPLRWLEIGLGALVIIFGALTIFAWRRK